MSITDDLLTNLGEIIGTNQSGENVYNIFTTCKELFDKEEAAFVIDPNKILLLQGVFFKREDTGRLTVILGQKYIDTYRKDSSLHHTMLIHELKHLYDCYLLKEEFYKCTYNKRHWFEFQARFIELEFIKNYLVDKFTLSRLEDLMLKCFENNDFNYYSILFSQVSYNVFKQFKDMETDYFNNKVSIEDIIREVIYNSHQIISEYLTLNDNYKRYAYFIIIKSFRNCLEDIILKRNDEPDILFSNLHEKYYFDLDYLYQKMYEIIDNYNEENKNYLLQLQYSLEENYTVLVTQQ
jgi:hypothetical protein